MRREAKITETVTCSQEETEELGRGLAASLLPRDVVYLIGNLGAGKTSLARGLAVGRGASPREVASPSFAILHEYAGPGGEIALRHLDLYRLEDSEKDLAILGLPASVAGAPVAVEWPGRAIRGLLPPTIEIKIESLPDGTRKIRWRSEQAAKGLRLTPHA